jgi:hypothetical protein
MNLKLLLTGAFLLVFVMLSGCVTGGGEGYINYPYDHDFNNIGSYDNGQFYGGFNPGRAYDYPSSGRNGW